MSKNYTQSTASLKTTTHDTFILDAQKVMVYPGSGPKDSRVNIIDTIKDAESKITDVSLVVSDVSISLNTVVNDVAAIETALNSLNDTYVVKTDYNSFVDSTNSSISTINTTLGTTAKTNAANTFSANNTFSVGLQALPLGATTITGQPAYGISVTPPSADGTSGGLQLWGVQFAMGDEWSDNALKIVHNELALFGNHQTPCSLTFDNANVVNFSVMPDDGSTANNGQGAIFDFQGWQWDNDSHTTKNANCPVQILKNNAGELVDRSLLNKSEIDANYAPITLSDTVSSLETDITTVSTVIADHQTDTTLHVSSSEKEGLTSLIANKDNFANKTEDTIFAKSVTVTGSAIFDSTISKSNNTTSPTNTTVLNKGESDALYAPKSHVSDTSIHTSAADKEALTELVNAAPQFAKKTEANTFTETNTFSKEVTAQNGIAVSGGDVVISEGVLTFEDLIDGTVVERSGASGYQYVQGMPTSFENGVCYDIGEISNTTNLTNVKFTGEGRLVQTCELWFTTPATPPTSHQWPTNIYWIDSATGAAPTLLASKNYRIVFRQEPNKIIASIAYIY